MLFVGDKVNSSSKLVLDSVKTRNFELLRQMIDSQVNDGANAIDINMSVLNLSNNTFDSLNEVSIIVMLGKYIANRYPEIAVSIDSPNILTHIEVTKYLDIDNLIYNSVSRLEDVGIVAPLLANRTRKIIVMPYANNDAKIKIAINDIVSKLQSMGVNDSQILVDCIVLPNGLNGHHDMLDIIKFVQAQFEQVGTIAGISNYSYFAKDRLITELCLLDELARFGLTAALVNTNVIRRVTRK